MSHVYGAFNVFENHKNIKLMIELGLILNFWICEQLNKLHTINDHGQILYDHAYILHEISTILININHIDIC